MHDACHGSKPSSPELIEDRSRFDTHDGWWRRSPASLRSRESIWSLECLFGFHFGHYWNRRDALSSNQGPPPLHWKGKQSAQAIQSKHFAWICGLGLLWTNGASRHAQQKLRKTMRTRAGVPPMMTFLPDDECLWRRDGRKLVAWTDPALGFSGPTQTTDSSYTMIDQKLSLLPGEKSP
jgi:hypothetical protein